MNRTTEEQDSDKSPISEQLMHVEQLMQEFFLLPLRNAL